MATALYDPEAVTPVRHVKWARLLKYSLYTFGWAVLLFVVIQVLHNTLCAATKLAWPARQSGTICCACCQHVHDTGS